MHGIHIVNIDIQALRIIALKIKAVPAFTGSDDEFDFIKLIKRFSYFKELLEITLTNVQGSE